MTWSRIIGATLLVWLTGCQPTEEVVSESTSAANENGISGDVAQASYSMGYLVASNMDERFAGSLDEDAFVTGLRDRFAGNDRQVSEEQAQSSLAALVAKQEQAIQQQSTDNRSAGSEFLAENGKREDVTTTASGLQYEVLVAGDDDPAKPAVTDTVSTHYHGTLIDGTVFDSSVTRGTPASFPVNGVIRGWTEALQLMAVGSKWRLFIPPDLAYGSKGRPGIPANSTLIFDVELLGIAGSG